MRKWIDKHAYKIQFGYALASVVVCILYVTGVFTAMSPALGRFSSAMWAFTATTVGISSWWSRRCFESHGRTMAAHSATAEVLAAHRESLAREVHLITILKRAEVVGVARAVAEHEAAESKKKFRVVQ